MKNAGKNSAAALGMVCWIVYFSIYLGRLNFSASMGDMTQTDVYKRQVFQAAFDGMCIEIGK